MWKSSRSHRHGQLTEIIDIRWYEYTINSKKILPIRKGTYTRPERLKWKMKTKLISMQWRGSASVDPRFSAAMLPWTIADIYSREQYNNVGEIHCYRWWIASSSNITWQILFLFAPNISLVGSMGCVLEQTNPYSICFFYFHKVAI